VVAGDNYAQGSSREHAAIAPRYLGQIAVLAKSYARIGWQNLVNFGIVPLEFKNEDDYDNIDEEDVIAFENLVDQLKNSEEIVAINKTKDTEIPLKHSMSGRQLELVLDGGFINHQVLQEEI